MGKLKAFEIVFANNKSVYFPGDGVTGKCILDLKGELKLKEIKMFMRGVAKVHWTESRSTGNRLGAYTEHYNAEIEYFFKKQVLCGSGNCIASVASAPRLSSWRICSKKHAVNFITFSYIFKAFARAQSGLCQLFSWNSHT